MRAFVTGGTGLLGRHLVEALLGRGWDVALLTRDPARARDLATLGARIVVGDVTRPKFQAEAGRADVLFHVAGWFELGVRDGRRMFEVNVTGTANVLSIARKEGIDRIVYTSTAGLLAPAPPERPATESGTPAAVIDDPYVATKLQAHQLVLGEMHAGLPVTVVMPAGIFGPHDTGQIGRTLALLVRGRLRVLPRGFGVNTWTHSLDVAEGHILAATRGRTGEAYLVADRVLPFETFIRLAAEAAGVPPPRRQVSMGLARFLARFSEARARMSGRTPLLSRASLATAALDLAVDASKARAELGWSPRPLEERIRETMAWYRRTYVEEGAPLPVKPGGASS